MSKSAWNGHCAVPRGRWRLVALGGIGMLLAACGGSDGSVGVGSGQDPDPVALDFPIAYTKGPLFDAQMQLQVNTDVRDLERFYVGTDLYLLDRASPGVPERNITFTETQGQGDVMGVEFSADGTRMIFSMRGPFDPNLNDDEQPTWKLWEYDIPSGTLRRIIQSDITAEAGHDVSPHYLPDGRIIYASTRQRQSKAILLDEGKPQFEAQEEDRTEDALLLHVIDSDGNNMHQVSFNQSHDYDPTVLNDGRVMFSRWDHAAGVNGIHLYTMNPDGTELELLYGAQSHLTGTNNSEVEFLGAREMLNGDIMAIIRQFDHPELGGDIVAIDARTYVENTQPTASNLGLLGPAQRDVTPNQVRTDLPPSQGGRFSSAFPLWDGTGRVLVTWSICRLIQDPLATPPIVVPCTAANLANPTAVVAPPLYGVWMYDPGTQTQLPVVIGQEGVYISEVVASQPRPSPQVIIDKIPGVDLDLDLAAQNAGIVNIRSVYDIDGMAAVNIPVVANPGSTTAAQRPARFLRVEKAVSIPDDDVRDINDTAFGPNIQLGMREIVGYAAVEPDGSVRMKVPANVALAVTVLDADGRRISTRHNNWLQVHPGDEVRCDGCHSPVSGLSHGRADSFTSVYAGAASTGVPFPNTVATFSPNAGETMAETRTRVSCQTDCAALEPSLDIAYADVWTDPNVRAPDAAFAYQYANLTTTPPTTLACMSAWTSTCRSTIHYQMHIHPLWGVVRQTTDAMGNVLTDHTCAQGGCHAPVDAMNAAAVPAAQLDLTDGLSPDEADHFNAYRELLFADNAQQVVGGALQDTGVTVNPSMSAAGANASNAFFSRFDAGGTHAGYLTPDELKLISEWLDIGAQYYNDPFAAPAN
jgi:hypothetical protein